MFCLGMASGMLIWGHTILQSYLQGIPFVIYWGTCFAFTIASIVIALLDVRAMLRNIKVERMTLAKRTMREVQQAEQTENADGDEQRSGGEKTRQTNAPGISIH